MARRWRASPRWAYAMGAASVVGVVAWKLATSSYSADIATICDAERRTGCAIRTDMACVSEGLRERLTTPEGNRFLSTLRDAPPADRASRLRREATAAGVPWCPMIDTYDEVAAEAAYRADVQRLCSYVTFPGLEELDDAARLGLLTAFLAEGATTERARTLRTALLGAKTAAQAAPLLRAIAAEIDVVTCDIAKVLEEPDDRACRAR